MDATDVACPAGVTNEIPKELQQYASRPLDIDDTIALLRLVAPGLMSKIEREHSMELNPVDCSHLPHGVPETPEEIERLRARWGNPLACHLPRAPATKFYTLYGIGKPTERGYLYTRRSGGCLSLLPFQIRTNVTDDVNVQRGVRLGEGDGTVPLISLGFLGAHAWTLVCTQPLTHDISLTLTHSLTRLHSHRSIPQAARRSYASMRTKRVEPCSRPCCGHTRPRATMSTLWATLASSPTCFTL